MEHYDLIIIGAGPAGLSAAVYGKRAGLNLLVLEKYPMSGGQILNTYEVDNYLGMPGMNGFDMGMKFGEHADRLGAEFLNAEVTGIETVSTDKETVSCGSAELQAASMEEGEEVRAGRTPLRKIVHTDQGDFQADVLILATGASHAKLGIPGEEEFSGKGVSYCATCDGAFYRGKRAAVIGGGDVALEDAVYLARFCEKVYCIHRRDEFRGARILQQKLLSLENVEILYSHIAVQIKGAGQVESLELENVKTGEKTDLFVDGVFVAVGIHPNTELFAGLTDRDRDGYIVAGEDGRTGTEGVFAAGDIRKKPLRQIVTAVADGANAAVAAGNYLNRFLKK